MLTLAMRRRIKWILAIAAALLLLAAAAPWIARSYWTRRASNPVRRGVQRARELGCFACHGDLGRRGIPDPGVAGLEVPPWGGSPGTRSVRTDAEIRETILHGSFPPHESPAVEMPAYEDALNGSDLDDLVAAYRVLSGSSAPDPGSDARRGLDLARRWRCFACHGPAGSGGAPNPGSLSGFIPGWYGADFEDLVRSRAEFDEWILDGSLRRLEQHRVASFFLRRQRLSMPSYGSLTPSELADLWAYVRWLDR